MTDFISNLRKTDKSTAIKRNNASCLIDDECNLNDYGEFSQSIHVTYNDESKLRYENHGLHTTFLDLDIAVVNSIYKPKLFDQRDKYQFFIVGMVGLRGKISEYFFYCIILSKFFKAAKFTLKIFESIQKAKQFF